MLHKFPDSQKHCQHFPVSLFVRMCGIFALLYPPEHPVQPETLKRSCSLLKHRGPDQAGYAILNSGTVGLGHNRLSIQAPDAPPQPLVDEATSSAIIFNGEVHDIFVVFEERIPY